EPKPVQGIDEMQHDAAAAGADRMAGADDAAVDVEAVARDTAGGAGGTQRVAGELVVLPGGEAAQHLRGEGLVDLPKLNVGQGQILALEDRGGAIDRTQSHYRGIERRPRAVDDDGLRL